MNIEARDILLKLSLYYKGDWDKIFEAIKNYEAIDFKIDTNINCNFVTILDIEYPEFLKKIFKPPFVLYYYGDFSLLKEYKNNVAFVGTRNPSEYGERITRKVISELKKDDVIISGMAKGIDGISHRAALTSGLKTVAVLGSGIDFIYPKENADLYKTIKENYLILSEYPNKTEPTQDSFLIRNRIIAGLSCAVVIPEAKIRSGSMRTAMVALNEGREVMAIPTNADVDSGANELIKGGASVVLTGKDVDFNKN